MIDMLDYNGDGKINTTDLIDFIKDLMKKEAVKKLLTGKDKKLNVINQIIAVIGTETFERYSPMIDLIIEWLYKNVIKSKCCKKWFRCCC